MTTDSITLRDKLSDPSLLRGAAFVNGEWTSSTSAFPVVDPSTGETIATLPQLGRADAQAAIESARAALPAWRTLPAIARSRILRRWAELVRENVDDLATILTTEQGKPFLEARGEVAYGAEFLDWFAEEGRRTYGDVIPSHTADARIIVIKQPVGVTAGITPWNLPAAMITRKAAPALAAGCTIVMKPAEQTPLTALALAHLGERAGLPAGVLSMLTTDIAEPIGTEFTENSVVRKLSFTGSTDVGKLLMSQASRNIQKLSLELGGNSPFIVFDDADVAQAVEGVVSAKYRNAGQICTGANRILVQRGIYDAFLEALTDRSRRVRVGNGFEEGVEMGPLIDDAGLTKVERHVADLLDHGGTLLTGGRRSERGHTFYEPTVIRDASPETLPWQDEETFGPIAAVIAFDDEDDAVELANATEYGLVAYVYTHDVGRVFRVSEGLETGMVAVNTGRVSNEQAPFGGWKQSGLGREGSRYGIDDWLELKYINLAGLSR